MYSRKKLFKKEFLEYDNYEYGEVLYFFFVVNYILVGDFIV